MVKTMEINYVGGTVVLISAEVKITKAVG